MKKMKLERNMNEEDMSNLSNSPEQFAIRECEKLKSYLFNEGYVRHEEEFRVVGSIYVDWPKRRIQAIVEKFPQGWSSSREDMVEEEEEVLLDISPSNIAGQYNLFALIPGISEEDIKISKYGNILEIRAKDYVGKVKVPEGINEISKAYKNGVLTLILR